MGARFFLFLGFIIISNAVIAIEADSLSGLPSAAELEKKSAQESQFATQDESKRSAIGNDEKVVLDKALEVLRAIDESVTQAVNTAQSSQETAWQNAKRVNAKKGKFSFTKAPSVVFDFVANFTDNTSESLMASNMAAIKFCQNKGDKAERSLMHKTVSSSVVKKTIQGGAFNLPPLSSGKSTCATIKKDFCLNVCAKELCGADAVYGAGCVWACWEDSALKADKKIQQCHMEFTSRFVHGTPADQANPCSTKKLQRAKSGRIMKLYSSVSGEQSTFAIAEACSKAMTEGLTPPPLCTKVLQTCSLTSTEQQSMIPWMHQFNKTSGMASPTVLMSPMMGMGGLGMGTINPMLMTPMPPMMPPMPPMMGGMPYGTGMPGMGPMMPSPGMPYGQPQGYPGAPGYGVGGPGGSYGQQPGGTPGYGVGGPGGSYGQQNGQYGGNGSGYDPSQGGQYGGSGGGGYDPTQGGNGYDPTQGGQYGGGGSGYDPTQDPNYDPTQDPNSPSYQGNGY